MPTFRIRLTGSAPVEGWITVEADDAAAALNTACAMVERDEQGESIEAIQDVVWTAMGYPAEKVEVMMAVSDIHEVAEDSGGIDAFAVPAEAHSDDGQVTVSFDAAPWLVKANPSAIVALAHGGWGGDDSANAVAEGLAYRLPTLQKLFAYLQAVNQDCIGDSVGFACRVDMDKAMAWLAVHRPVVAHGIHTHLGGTQ